jgi:hypothetical protein
LTRAGDCLGKTGSLEEIAGLMVDIARRRPHHCRPPSMVPQSAKRFSDDIML